MRNYKETDTKNNGAPAWMTTYGDMVTLVLTFFIMLFSFSTIDATKWQELVAALSGNPAVMEGGKTIDEFPLESSSLIAEQLKSIEKIDDFERLYISLKEYIEENELDAYVEVTKSETEILIRFLDNVLFELGKADIKEEALTILDRVANALYEYQEIINMVRIEGHTDNLPINTVMFPSNWELSVARAVNVLDIYWTKRV